jgi:hypothetical protein
MRVETIKDGAKTMRNRTRRVANGLREELDDKPMVVAIDRAQRAVSDFGESAYEKGQQVARQIGSRPVTVGLLLGGAMLAGASAYLLLAMRRR